LWNFGALKDRKTASIGGKFLFLSVGVLLIFKYVFKIYVFKYSAGPTAVLL